MRDMPIIRLEIEGMKASILHALTEYELQMDSLVKEAIERQCSSEHIHQLINYETSRAIDEAVKDEINNFFKYGKGRDAIKSAICDKLSTGL